MGSVLPVLEKEAFQEELWRTIDSLGTDGAGSLGDEDRIHLEEGGLEAMWIHYRELTRWNPRLSLVGPGTGSDLLGRHFGEAMAAMPHLPSRGRILDVGSGGGFPGLVLAAARPGLDVCLMEPKQRKWSFLQTVIRKVKAEGIPLSCRALDARVENPLPASPALPQHIEIVTCRALTLGPARVRILTQLYSGVRFLLWTSLHEADIADADPRSSGSPDGVHGTLSAPGTPEASSELGPEQGFAEPYRCVKRIPLRGSRHRHIVDLMPTGAAS